MAKGLKGQAATQEEVETHRGQRRSGRRLCRRCLKTQNMISHGFTALFDGLLAIAVYAEVMVMAMLLSTLAATLIALHSLIQ